MTKHAEDLAKLGWQYFECPACGSEGARAFSKPEQEPVAWKLESGQAIWFERTDPEAAPALLPPDVTMTPLYTTPPNRPSRSDIKPLTEEEIENIANSNLCIYSFARAIEAAHGIKGNT